MYLPLKNLYVFKLKEKWEITWMHSCASRCYVGIKWCVHRKHKKVNVMYFNNFSTCLDLIKSSFCHLIEVSSLKGMQILVVPMFIQVAFNRPLVHAFFISTWLQHSTPCCTSWTTWTKKKRIMQVYLFEASVVEIYFLTSHVFTAWTPLDNENLWAVSVHFILELLRYLYAKVNLLPP